MLRILLTLLRKLLSCVVSKWLRQGDILKAYLEDLFSACLGADSDILVQIVKAYQMGHCLREIRILKILMQLVNWEVKTRVLGIFLWHTRLIDCSEAICFADISPLTLRKRRNLRFLQHRQIVY